MSEHSDPAGRRRFLKLVGGSVALVPLAGLGGCGGGNESPPAAASAPKPATGSGSGAGADMAKETQAAAEKAQAAAEMESSAPASAGGDSLPKLSLDDPQAKALGYVHDATKVDSSKYPRHQAGQACHNCALFQGQGDAEWGPCSIFPGKRVNASGWCSAYAPKG